MSTKLPKRQTKQIRIGEEKHRKLKVLAAQKGTTISRLADRMADILLNEEAPYPIS